MFWRGVTTATTQVIAPEESGEGEEGQEERRGEERERREERIEWKGGVGEEKKVCVIVCPVACNDGPNNSVMVPSLAAPPVVDSIRAMVVGSIVTGRGGSSMT